MPLHSVLALSEDIDYINLVCTNILPFPMFLFFVSEKNLDAVIIQWITLEKLLKKYSELVPELFGVGLLTTPVILHRIYNAYQ